MPDDRNPEPVKEDQPAHPLRLKCQCDKCDCDGTPIIPAAFGWTMIIPDGLCEDCYFGSHAPRRMTVKK